MSMLEIIRIILGSVFVLFAPGFSWSFVFFKKGDIDLIERVALSFGLSIALVPLLVFYLNFLFHVKINLANVSLTIIFLLIAPLIYLRFGQKIVDNLKLKRGQHKYSRR